MYEYKFVRIEVPFGFLGVHQKLRTIRNSSASTLKRAGGLYKSSLRGHWEVGPCPISSRSLKRASFNRRVDALCR